MGNMKTKLLALATMAAAMGNGFSSGREIGMDYVPKEDKSYLRKKCKSCSCFHIVGRSCWCSIKSNKNNPQAIACKEYIKRK